MAQISNMNMDFLPMSGSLNSYGGFGGGGAGAAGGMAFGSIANTSQLMPSMPQ
jgi:hypothetical protein